MVGVVYERDIEHMFATFKMKWERFHGHVRFLDRAIVLIDAGACRKVTEDLNSLAERKIPWVCSHSSKCRSNVW